MPPIVPDTLLQQRYRILNMIGEGEFRRIYLATDSARTATAGHDRTDEYCAIEEFTPTEQFPAAVARAKEFLKQQASLLYQLQHIQVPRFWAIFEEQNRLFLVRDYVEGKTYQHLLEQRRDSGKTFSEDEVWRFMLQILPAIGYIHSKGAIHRDISPENIILRDRDRLPVLNNFGVVTEFAQRLQADPFSQDLIKIGQPGYACPEQLRGGQIYPNSDLYSLAVTAIVLLTGKEASALFEGDRMNWDWQKWTPISDDFANVLQRMLAQPQERYQSAIEVEQDLQSLQIADRQSSEPTDSDLNYPIVEDRVDTNRSVELPNISPVASNKLPAATQESVTTTNPPILPSQPIPPIKSEVTNLDIKSFWEKPQVFIPLGLAIALLTGLLSWFGVSFLLHRQTDNTPPKQADFNNPTTPTLPTDRSPTVVGSELIQPIMDRAVMREGTVGANTPVKYRIAAVAGQNLDIQLLPIASQNSTSTTPNPTGATDPNGSPATPPTSATSTPNDPNNPSAITSTPAPSANQSGATQVLMSVLSPSGVPVDPQAERVIGWRGQITTAGEQTIELRPIKGLTGTSFPYKLSVTQVGIAPPIAPTPAPSPDSIPPAGVTTPPTNSPTVPPVSVPVPIGGNGLNPNPPTSPNPNLIPPGDLPTTIPTPAPTDLPTTLPNNAPTESAPPPRRRRRARVDADTTTTPRQIIKRSEASNEETPTPPRRRKRNRIVTNSEQTTPTPTPRRQRRNRSATADPQPGSTPKSGNTNNPPSDAPGIPIDVPTPSGAPAKSEPKSDAPGIPIQVPTPKR